ncbi:adenosine deaminase [Streptoalloteichus tenebrarius]|uniref:Adenosine deaminase n=1 Tax=Streptoalloteichus tenebrarius (strain ATCC 17920 / DSM 40477 / JCM 4838 / CBS 697.72 / NBRC 16177 / NCIMB 11028 / NRRL B-12390 / A12253. 1 / ISP 5477) TaxID=1933 RepID=A0ABT1HS58_STRSD|nr:adenosine deaminase [Streptoalloteichus tenebrarius]MCP2258354.1 adenosine deaminase [Streptoalloteichus tenebrarius]BFF03521.1 adenosine deaminase [Streptoalloteichus tenebrarius]
MGDTQRTNSRPPRDLRALPKAHLHLHLAGSLRPATLRELAERHGLPDPRLPSDPEIQGWARFQELYDAARAVLRTAEDLRRVVVEAAAADAEDGCGWLEIQVDPTAYAPLLGGTRAVLEAVLAGAAEAPVPTGVIVSSSWARPAAHAERLAALAAEYAGAGVVGFGLSNDERLGRPSDFARAFRIAAEAGLLGTPHSGFFTGPAHVRECVEVLGAARVGHGTSAASDPATLALLAERRVALEVCPTSYPPFGVHELADVPVATLLDAGVPVALAADDPLLFGVGLLGQYEICRTALGLSDQRLAAVAGDGIRSSSAPEPLRVAMLSTVDAWLAGRGPDLDAG